MRAAIHDLYVDDDSPLREMGDVRRIETYAPIVEAAVVARIHAPQTPLCKEMLLNLRHMRAAAARRVPRLAGHRLYEVASCRTCRKPKHFPMASILVGPAIAVLGSLLFFKACCGILVSS